MKNVLLDCNVNFLALPTSNVLKDRRAKMGFAKMAALITKIVLDSTYAFKKDVSTPALWAKLADPTQNVRPEIRLNIVVVPLDLPVYQLLSKAVFESPKCVQDRPVLRDINVSMGTACLLVNCEAIAQRVNNALMMECV